MLRHRADPLPLVQDPVSGKLVSSGRPTGLLFVAADATSVLDFLHSTFQLFFITAAAVLLISLVICSITVQRMVDPLKGMCAFAHRFAHGEVDTRVTEYTNRNDEIGELAIAFNAMADSLAQAEQKRSEFVANVSHELKTPMTTIAGFADGILDGTIPRKRSGSPFRSSPPKPAGSPGWSAGCWSSPGCNPPSGWPPRSSLTQPKSSCGS